MSPDIPLIDHDVLDALIEAFADDPEGGLDELLATFFEHMPPRIVALGQALSQGDRKAIKTLAHSLKGSCANFGARGVAGKCALLEETVERQQDGTSLTPQVSELVEEIAVLYHQTEVELRASIRHI